MIGSLLLGGAALVGGLFSGKKNRQSTEDINQRQIDFSREMYNRQRADFLMDRAYSERYDLPSAQMQRLKDAGLSPHLMYGQGSVGSTPNPQRASALGANLKAPDYGYVGEGISSAISTYLAVKQQEATVKNIEANTRNTTAKAFEQEFNNSILDRNWANAIRLAKSYSIADMRQTVLNKTLENSLKQEMIGEKGTQYNVIGIDAVGEAQSYIGYVRSISSSHEKGRNLSIERATKEIEKIGAEVQNIMKSTDLRKQQERMNELEIKFNRELGLPPNSPWLAALIAKFIKAHFGISVIDF